MSSVHCNPQLLCKVFRERDTISCSGHKDIILSLYDVHNFVFTYIKIHFVSKDASVLREHSLSSVLHEVGPTSASPLGRMSSLLLPRWGISLAHSHNTTTGLTVLSTIQRFVKLEH